MAERNSEKQLTVVGGVTMVVVALGAVCASLLSSGLQDHWPAFATVAAVVMGLAKAVGDYSKSRPEKHKALNEARRIDAALPPPVGREGS